jgi:cell division protein FtsQ
MPRKKLRTPFFNIPRKTIITVLAAVAVVLACVGVWQVKGTIAQFAGDFVARSVGAKVAHIPVEGADQTDPEALKAAIGLEMEDSLVGFDVQAARARLEELPWVAEAVVSRRLPDTVKIQVFEHEAVARLKTEEDIWLITKTGQHIVPAENRFANLPLLRGGGAGQAAASLLALLVPYPNFALQLQAADFVGERRWDLNFKSGLQVKLPAQNPARALTLLQQLETRRHVLSLSGGMVDLRLEDRVVLELPVNSAGTDLVL